MHLKIIIVVLFLVLVISMVTGAIMLFQDQGGTKRTWHSLSFRLVIATLMMAVVIYGVYTGQLGSNAAWDKHTHDELFDKKSQSDQ